LPRASDADDDADAPSFVTALERLPHHLHVADALEAVIGAALGEVDEVRNQVAADVARIHEVRHAESFGERAPTRVQVDADDLLGAHEPRALHDVEADAAEAEYDDARSRLDLRGVDHGANARRDAATDVADLVERRVRSDLGKRDFRYDRMRREGQIGRASG